jgi:hypothetical protein
VYDKQKKAINYVEELNEKLTAYRRFVSEKIPELFAEHGEGRKPPKAFKDSSFLYIRSYDGDNGTRPFSKSDSNIIFWNSPDISVAPLTDTAAYTNTVIAGMTYIFSCNIRNRGDLIIPSANVEFYLVNPSLGFDTRFATRLGITNCWVNSQGVGRAAIQYTIPPSESGHKCLIVRTYTYSPLDITLDDYQLWAPIDRHVAQLNLDIIGQSSNFIFDLVHLPQALEHVAFVPMTRNEILKLRHPFLADYKIVDLGSDDRLGTIELNVIESNQEIEINREEFGFRVTIKSDNGISIEEQAKLMDQLRLALIAVNEGKEKPSHFRNLFQSFRDMNKEMQKSTFRINVPDFDLDKGEAGGFHIVDNSAMFNKETKGGITLIVTN